MILNSISVLIPTAGRPTLRRALESVLPQMQRADEVIVIGDTHGRPEPEQGDYRLPETAEICREFGARVRYYEHDAGFHDWGHSQLNHGMTLARGSWIHCNDDDDIYTPRALDAMRAAVGKLDVPRPILFRFRAYFGLEFWDREGVVAENHIGGHCLLMPNVEWRKGAFTSRYQGDFDWIRSTLDLWAAEEPVWDPTIIAIARPS